jgi:signal transduction histidine kinase
MPPISNRSFISALVLRRHWLMLAMLFLLHIATLLQIDDPWMAALLVSHLGIFILWQPMWSGEHKVSASALTLIGIACTSVLLWLSWWLVAFWLAVLFALVGGRVFSFRAKWLQLFYLAAMLYLLALLLLWVTPHLFAPNMVTEMLRYLTQYGLLFVLIGMTAMPVENEPIISNHAVDFFYSVLLFLLVVVLVLGSFTFMILGSANYLEALSFTLFSLAVLLLTLGWLWNPRFGFSGLQHLFSRYLLNVGTPMDEWLSGLAQSSEQKQEAAGFLNSAMHQLSELPWIKGVTWQSPSNDGKLGNNSEHLIKLEEGQLRLNIYTKYEIKTAVLLHTRLLVQIIGQFYETKYRENILQRMTRLQTIYETGSRLTHDIKNLLQSLYTLISAGQQATQIGETKDFQKMLNRQLPALTHRLEHTLKKLSAPQKEPSGEYVSTTEWWDLLKSRYHNRNIKFENTVTSTQLIPSAVFENVADNLLDNARKKRMTEMNIKVVVHLIVTDSVAFTVCDTGEPIPETVASKLFHDTVDSETGLGTGLYQAYRWAEQHGYLLSLKNNEQGAVCFMLEKRKTSTITPDHI